MWREGLETALRCMTEVPFGGVDGKYVKMPPRNVVPKPVQKPHPPVWVACSRRETILLAAECGIGALTFSFIDPEEAVHWVGDYRKTLAEKCVPIGSAINPEISCVTPMMCHQSEREAILRGLEGGNFFGYSLGHYYVFGDHKPGVSNVWEEFTNKRAERGYSPDVAIAMRQRRLSARLDNDQGDQQGLRGAVGTPDQLREYFRRFEDAGVDQMIFVMQAGKNRHEHIMESIELFGKEVLPEFAARDGAIRAKKMKELEPIIEMVMKRKRDDCSEDAGGLPHRGAPEAAHPAGRRQGDARQARERLSDRHSAAAESAGAPAARNRPAARIERRGREVGTRARSASRLLRDRAGFAQRLQIGVREAPVAQCFLGMLARLGRRALNLARRARESRRRPRLCHAALLDESSAMLVVRMLRRFIHVEHRREANVAALHDLAPLVASLGAENRLQPLLHRGPRLAILLMRQFLALQS